MAPGTRLGLGLGLDEQRSNKDSSGYFLVPQRSQAQYSLLRYSVLLLYSGVWHGAVRCMLWTVVQSCRLLAGLASPVVGASIEWAQLSPEISTEYNRVHKRYTELH